MHYTLTTHPTYKIIMHSAAMQHKATVATSPILFVVKYDTVSIDQNSVLIEQGFWRMYTTLVISYPPSAHFILINFNLKA